VRHREVGPVRDEREYPLATFSLRFEKSGKSWLGSNGSPIKIQEVKLFANIRSQGKASRASKEIDDCFHHEAFLREKIMVNEHETMFYDLCRGEE